MKNRILANALTGKKSTLISRAKKLGIKDDLKKSKVEDIREKIAKKVHGQSATKSNTALGGGFIKGKVPEPTAGREGRTHLSKRAKRLSGKARVASRFKAPKGGRLGLALSLLYPLISGQFGGGEEPEILAAVQDERQPNDWEALGY